MIDSSTTTFDSKDLVGSSVPAAQPHRRNILICDDDRTTRYLLRRILVQRLNAVVHQASNGLEALTHLTSTPTDLLILDLRMPVMDGPETLETIRKTPALANLPVIVLTGETQPDVIKQVIRLGVTDYLRKPITRPATQERLERIIANLLRSHDGVTLPKSSTAGPRLTPAPSATLMERFPDLRAQMISGTEIVFGMMTKMEVTQLDGPTTPFTPPYLVAQVVLAAGSDIEIETGLRCTQSSGESFAVAMSGVPEDGDAGGASDAVGELVNIVAGRVKNAMTEQMTYTLGLPHVVTIQPGETDTGEATELIARFGVIGTQHELEVSLLVRERAL